jgi:hypothetical protein
MSPDSIKTDAMVGQPDSAQVTRSDDILPAAE